MTEKSTAEGGCLCGRIRFSTTSNPSYQLFCYCTDCQTISGAASCAAYGVPIESIALLKGAPNIFDIVADSGRTNSRRFCPACESRVWAQIDEVGLAGVNALTLDDKSHFQPASNHCPESAPAWCEIDNSLECFGRIPRVSKWRPVASDTRNGWGSMARSEENRMLRIG